MNKTNLYFIGLLIAAMLFVSCNDDDDKKDDETLTSIEATVSGVPSEVKDVRLILHSEDVSQVLKNVEFSAGKFKIELPQTVPDEYLFKFNVSFRPGVVISDPNALVSWEISLNGFDGSSENANRIGWFFYRNQANTARLFLAYANSDFSIIGEYSEEDDGNTNNFKFDMRFKKGWNKLFLVYTPSTRTESWSMIEPAGLTWYFDLPED